MSGSTLLVVLLGVLFIGLKLGGVIAWSWLWVLSPFWIGPVVFVIGLAIICIIAALASSRRY